MKSITKNSLFNLAYIAVDSFIPLLISGYVARVLLSGGVGRVAYAQNTAGYFSAFAQFSITYYGVREIARAGERLHEVNRLFTELFLINCLTTTAALSAYVLFLWRSGGLDALALACGVPVAVNYLNISWLYQGKEEYVYLAARNIAVKVLSLAAVLQLVHAPSDIVGYALIAGVATGCGYICDILCAHRYVSPTWAGLDFRRHAKPLLLLAAGELSFAAFGKIHITILGKLSSPEALGCYSYAQSAAQIVLNLCTAIPAAGFPRLNYYYRADRGQFWNLLRLELQSAAFLTIPACAGCILMAPSLMVLLFGDSFLPSAAILQLLAPLVMIQAVSSVLCVQMLFSTGNEWLRIPVYLAGCAGIAALDHLLIPAFSANGAAVALTVCELAITGGSAWRMYRMNPFPFPARALLEAVFSTAVMCAAVKGILHLAHTPLMQCIAGMAGGMLVYGIVNLMIGSELLWYVVKKFGERAAAWKERVIWRRSR